MKRVMLSAVAIVMSGLSLAWAGHFTDILPPASASGSVPVSNGYDYNLSGDTGAPSPNFAAAITPFVRTAAQIAALVPTTTGQILIISNPSTFNVGTYGLCMSSGILAGAWVQISSAAAITACK